MSTRSRIGLKNSDGTITSIYCHWDGYVEGVGDILVNYYKDVKKIKKLLKLGDLSSLGTEPEDNPDAWNIKSENCYNASMCNSYASRGEKCPARTSKTREEFVERTNNCGGEYAYLFDDGEWLVCDIWKAYPETNEEFELVQNLL